MKYALSALLLAPALLALGSVAPAADESNDLSAVVDHMKAVDTMTANFTQTDRNGKVLSGKMKLKRPGHVRFEYGDAPLLIVADGKALVLIDYEVKQVQRWPIKNSPMTALLDPGNELARYGKRVPSGEGTVSVAVKDNKRPEFGTTTMVFQKSAGAPAGLSLNGWVTLDSKGNRTSIRLSNIKFNVAVADSSFTWKDPRPKSRK